MMAKIIGWLTGAGTQGIVRWVWIVGIAAAIALVVTGIRYFVDTAFDRTEQLGREAGTQGAVIAGQNQTLEQLGDANHAEDNLRAGGERSAERYAECLRNSRNKPACERYNPDPRQ